MIGAGQSIGNYRILSKIGTGGMGAVYLAEHPLIGKRVALKVIHHELSSNKEVVQRFFQEARAVNTIGNHHIVEIHDFGQTPDGDHFYIMEYLEGTTLASQLAKHTALDVMRALHIGAQIASALQAAHAAGIIHRDLKPDNIMLVERLGNHDFVKVLDFGLAKFFAAGGSAVKTAAGVLLGTPQYMSPEACESKVQVDYRTDIYALGVLLFQMLTGVLPFDGESMGEVLVKQVTQLPPAPRGLNPEIPPSVEQILLRCLAKKPEARFNTMEDLRSALLDPEAYLRGSPPIAAARSVAPGEAKVDAKTVMAHVRAMQAAKQQASAPAAGAGRGNYDKTRIGSVGPVEALPAIAPPKAVENKTMQIGTPYGYQSATPKRVWPIVLVLGLLLGLGGGAFAVAWVDRDSSSGSDEAAGSDDTGSDDGSAGSAEPGSDHGSAHAGSARTSVANAGSDAASGSDDGSASAGSAATGSAAASGSDDGSAASGSAAAGSAAPATRIVKLVIDSTPEGAQVYDSDGTSLGKTRLEIDWPAAKTPVVFELRHRGFKTKRKKVVVDGAMTIGIDLERIRRVPTHPKGGSNHDADNGLMRPGE